jgi:hypothetical protein
MDMNLVFWVSNDSEGFGLIGYDIACQMVHTVDRQEAHNVLQ